MKRKQLKASALIEFAIVMPILMLLIAGITDFGSMLYNKAVITSASREGARYGIVMRNPTYATMSAVQSYTQTYCTNRMLSYSTTKPSVSVVATPSTNPPKFGDTLTVTVSYSYTDLILHNLITKAATTNLTATTVMAYE